MNTPDPIRSKELVVKLKSYYREIEPHPRNYLLIMTGLNTALRISDILSITIGDVYNIKTKRVRSHLCIKEKKTGKASNIYINKQLSDALHEYIDCNECIILNMSNSTDRLFDISRIQAWRIIKKAANHLGIEGVISCHSLRKTFGYFAWKQGVEPAMLMDIYNHSSYRVTRRYLGITQDDRDKIFDSVEL